MKGVAALIGSGTVEDSPQAVASFLRQHIAELDKTQLGEYFGHHDEQAVSLLASSHNHIRLLIMEPRRVPVSFLDPQMPWLRQ